MKRRYIKGLARETRYISVSMGKALIYYIIKPLSTFHHQILATKAHKGAQRKKDNKNHLNKKFLEVRYNETYFQNGFWPPETIEKKSNENPG